MTLIAAYSCRGVPMLMGDLLITNSGVPSTIRKKVTILTKNLAVGWTGSLPTARAIIGKLRQTLPSEGILDKKWLEDALTAYAADDFGHLGINLVGWLIADKDYCFRWRSDYPTEVFYGDPMVDGSGAPACRRHFGEDGSGSHTSRKRSERDDLNRVDLNQYHIPESLHHSLNVATKLMSDEILSTGFYRSFGIGHAYEIAYLGNSGFQYLNNLLYFVLTLHFDEYGSCISQAVESPYYKYYSEQEHAILWKYSHTQNHVHVDIIEPLDFTNPEFVKRTMAEGKAGRHSDVDYFCFFVNILAPGYRGPMFTFVLPASMPEDAPIQARHTNHGIALRISHEIVDKLYKMIREHRLGEFSP